MSILIGSLQKIHLKSVRHSLAYSKVRFELFYSKLFIDFLFLFRFILFRLLNDNSYFSIVVTFQSLSFSVKKLKAGCVPKHVTMKNTEILKKNIVTTKTTVRSTIMTRTRTPWWVLFLFSCSYCCSSPFSCRLSHSHKNIFRVIQRRSSLDKRTSSRIAQENNRCRQERQISMFASLSWIRLPNRSRKWNNRKRNWWKKWKSKWTNKTRNGKIHLICRR